MKLTLDQKLYAQELDTGMNECAACGAIIYRKCRYCGRQDCCGGEMCCPRSNE